MPPSTTIPNSHEKRLDIELLRVIAAILVLLYHAGVPGFEAGYIGVDVFLVISGFVIAQAWQRHALTGTSKPRLFVTFLARRVARIFPAMALVIGASLLAGYVFMPPQALTDTSIQATASLLFSSNVLLSLSGGYFNESSAALPLTHLWTIALEVHFYILFALAATVFTYKRHLALVVLALSLGSLVLTLANANSIHGSPYLLLHYRFWEFGLGVLSALVLMEQKSFGLSHLQKSLTTLLALCILGYGLTIASDFAHHPGALLLIPVLASLIIVGTPTTNNDHKPILTSFLLLAGACSYPIYLWHQPVFSMAKYASVDIGEPSTALLLIVLVIVISLLTHALLDRKLKLPSTPFNYSKIATQTGLFLVAAITSGTMLKTNGFEGRLPEYKMAVVQYFDNSPPKFEYFAKSNLLAKLWIGCDFMDNEAALNMKPHYYPRKSIDQECFTKADPKKPSMLIWGSSHAMHLRYGIEVNLRDNLNILQVASSSCPPRLGSKPSKTDYCEKSNWFAQKTIEQLRPEFVVLSGLNDYSTENVNALAMWLKSTGVKLVMVVGPTLTWNAPLPQLMMNDLDYRLDYPETKSKAFLPSQYRKDRTAKSNFEQSKLLTYVSVFDAFCTKEGCETYFTKDFLRYPTTWDQSHLTDYASEVFFNRAIGPAMFNVLNR